MPPNWTLTVSTGEVSFAALAAVFVVALAVVLFLAAFAGVFASLTAPTGETSFIVLAAVFVVALAVGFFSAAFAGAFFGAGFFADFSAWIS